MKLWTQTTNCLLRLASSAERVTLAGVVLGSDDAVDDGDCCGVVFLLCHFVCFSLSLSWSMRTGLL